MNDSPSGVIPLTSTTTIFGARNTASMQGPRTATRKPSPIPTMRHFIVTPWLPELSSKHGSAGSAASEVMRRLYGEAAHSITFDESCGAQHRVAVTHHSGRLLATFPTRGSTGDTFPNLNQEAAAGPWAGLSGAAVYRTTCVLRTMTTNSSARKNRSICVISTVKAR